MGGSSEDKHFFFLIAKKLPPHSLLKKKKWELIQYKKRPFYSMVWKYHEEKHFLMLIIPCLSEKSAYK